METNLHLHSTLEKSFGNNSAFSFKVASKSFSLVIKRGEEVLEKWYIFCIIGTQLLSHWHKKKVCDMILEHILGLRICVNVCLNIICFLADHFGLFEADTVVWGKEENSSNSIHIVTVIRPNFGLAIVLVSCTLIWMRIDSRGLERIEMIVR